MVEFEPQHPLSYRREVAGPLFDLISKGECCAIIAAASTGKSRLLRFVLRSDVQAHYLGVESAGAMLVLVDCNRLAEMSDWGFYELLLTSLTEASGGAPAAALRGEFGRLRSEVIANHNGLLARRNTELALHMLCREQGVCVCFLLDEFDGCYRSLSASALANLRAVRDNNKYLLTYVLMLREPPASLRTPGDCEGFYELFSRSLLGLKPYSPEDARYALAQIAARKGLDWGADVQDSLLWLSGGHPGLLLALSDSLSAGRPAGQAGDAWLGWALQLPDATEECRKIWEGLNHDEQVALSHLAQGIGMGYTASQSLALKGLIRLAGPNAWEFFTPLLAEYVRQHGTLSEKALWLDETTDAVWVEGKIAGDLSPLESKLLFYLYRHRNKVCKRDDLLLHLYPNEPLTDVDDNRLESLVRRLREAIEPDPKHPLYLLTVRSQGYRLTDSPAKGS